MPEIPKIRSLYTFAISPEKHGAEVGFLLVNKHESFLQIDSITSGVHPQPGMPKVPKTSSLQYL